MVERYADPVDKQLKHDVHKRNVVTQSDADATPRSCRRALLKLDVVQVLKVVDAVRNLVPIEDIAGDGKGYGLHVEDDSPDPQFALEQLLLGHPALDLLLKTDLDARADEQIGARQEGQDEGPEVDEAGSVLEEDEEEEDQLDDDDDQQDDSDHLHPPERETPHRVPHRVVLVLLVLPQRVAHKDPSQTPHLSLKNVLLAEVWEQDRLVVVVVD